MIKLQNRSEVEHFALHVERLFLIRNSAVKHIWLFFAVIFKSTSGSNTK